MRLLILPPRALRRKTRRPVIDHARRHHSSIFSLPPLLPPSSFVLLLFWHPSVLLCSVFTRQNFMHVSSLYNGARGFLPGLPRKSAHPHKLEEGLVGQVSISFLVAVCPDYDYFILPPPKISPDQSGLFRA